MGFKTGGNKISKFADLVNPEQHIEDEGWPTEDPNLKQRVIYGIYDEIPLAKAIPLGIQHVLTMFGLTTLIPLLIAQGVGLDAQQTGALLGTVYFVMGVATIVQLTIGSRLPIVQGSSASFVSPFLAIAGQVQGGALVAMQYISGALIGGGLVEFVLGYGNVIRYVKKLFTPQVTAPTIMMIGLSLYQPTMNTASSYWPVAIMTLLLVLAMEFISPKTRMVAVIVGIVLSWIISGAGAAAGIFPSQAAVNLAPVGEAPWIMPPQPFRWGVPKFEIGFILVGLAGYLASMIESVGDYHAVSTAAGCKDPDSTQVTRGIGAEGLGGIISGIFGGVGTTSYTENIGVVGLTGVAARIVVAIGSVVLILLGVIRKFGVMIATLPSPVTGGVYIIMFATIAGVGAQHLNKIDMTKPRNYTILGLALLLGIGVPFYVGSNPIEFQPMWLSDIIQSIASTGMAVGALTAMVLDNILPEVMTDEEVEKRNQ